MTAGAATVRDVDRERDWTTSAAAISGIDTTRLSDFAQRRAGDSPVRDLVTRDFAVEVLEELADARNYLAWWDEQIHIADRDTDLDHARAEHVGALLREVLAGVAYAFEKAEHARVLTRELQRPVRLALASAIDASADRYPGCRCHLHPSMTDGELVALGGGCTHPHYCCPRLAAVRRRVLS